MSGFSEGLKTVNSFARTIIVGIFVAVIGFGGYFAYTTLIAPLIEDRQALAEAKNELETTKVQLKARQEALDAAQKRITLQQTKIAEQQSQIKDLGEQIEKLETAMRLLKVDHRLAKITVLSIEEDPKTDDIKTKVALQEIDADGNPIGKSNEFVIKGRNIYVDFWLAKFEDKYVEQSDLLRSTTLCMFKSIYGEQEAPVNATPIEKPWVRPEAYAGGSKMSDFERKIWEDFWTIANDNSKSKELGIRANHGQAVYVKAEVGKSYLIELRASDGLTFKSIDDQDKDPEG